MINSLKSFFTNRISVSDVIQKIPEIQTIEADLLVDSIGSINNIVKMSKEDLFIYSPISELASLSINKFFEE